MKASIIHRAIEKFRRTFFPIHRYEHLFSAIDEKHCRNIMEIGTWTGKRSEQMIEVAARFLPAQEISFFGFDLFELLTDELNEKEFSKKPPTMAEVKSRLEKTGAAIKLYKGFTKDTLPQAMMNLPKMDLIFIDGGHAVETIQNDWLYSEQLMHNGTVVIFDDYYRRRDDLGCKPVVEKIDKNLYKVEIIEPHDRVLTPWWQILDINFVKVTKKSP